MTTILETPRLRLRELSTADADFVLELLNEPSWHRYIGDRGIHSEEAARRYITDGPRASYSKNGFGLWKTELKKGDVAVGICGLVNREALDDIDIGFAFLSRFWGHGYARESAAAVLGFGHRNLGLRRIVAITTEDNHASVRVLERIGLKLEGPFQMAGDDARLLLFAHEEEASAANGGD